MTNKKTTVTTPYKLARGVAPFWEFANSDLPSEALGQRAAALLDSKDLVRDVQGLTPEDQTKFIDKVDQIYPTLDSRNARYLAALGNICSATQRLPTSAILSTGVTKSGEMAVGSGGLTDIWRGYLRGSPVAIKAFRIYPAENLKVAKEILWKRVPVWKRLNHPNILPFRGVSMAPFQLALVYDWGQNGNITQYISSQPNASRPSLLFDVTKGLEYLHSLDIPHGDLKGANVVIDWKGRARLTDYGLALINSDPSFTVAATPGAVGNSRWLAPEIITPPRKGASMPAMETKAADIFAFGMFAVEVFTGKIPFNEQKNEAAVLRISRGDRPGMPENAQTVGLTTEMWNLFENCWQENPKKRPAVQDVVKRWRKFIEHIKDDDLSLFPGEPQTAEKAGESSGRRRTRTEAVKPETTTEAVRLRTRSDAVQSRTKPEIGRPRRSSALGERLGSIPQSPVLEVAQPTPKFETDQQPQKSRVHQQQGVHNAPQPRKRRKWFCGLF